MQEETKVTDNTQKEKEEFLQNFISNKNEVQSVSIAKEQDKINLFEAKIKDIKAVKENQNDTIKACKSVIDSNAYPRLNPIISSFSAHLEKMEKKKDKKIAKTEKKVKKAQRKIKKLKSKQKRKELLKSFISSMHSSTNKQTAYIEAMRALKEDSLGRADKQLDKTEARIVKITERLKSGKLSEVDKIKLNAQVKKLESKRDKLISRINNLNELEQELNKLAKIELVDDKVDELRNTAVETAEKAAMNGSSVSETIDNVTENSNEVIKEVLEPDKVEQISDNMKNDKPESWTDALEHADIDADGLPDIIDGNIDPSEDRYGNPKNPPQDKEKQVEEVEPTKDTNKNLVKRVGITQEQLWAIQVTAGIAVQPIQADGDKCTIIYSKDKSKKVQEALNAVQTKKPMKR